MKLWQYLGKKELQELIGDSILDQLESILPALESDSLDDPSSIFNKNNLVKIVEAFQGGNICKNPKLLSAVLNHVSDDAITLFLSQNFSDIRNLSFSEKIRLVVDNFFVDREFALKFLQWADFPEAYVPLEEPVLPSEIFLERASAPYKTLKDYQYSVFFKAQKELEINLSRFVLQMPTGSGKTRTAMEIVTHFLNNSTEDTSVVWLAHSEELCEQALECFMEVWRHVARKDLLLFRAWGKNASVPHLFDGSAFIVGGFQKMHSVLKNNPHVFNKLKSKVGLIVVDEAHKVIAPTYAEVTSALMNNKTKVIGLTATPGRGIDNEEQNRALSDFFFNKNITISTPRGENVIAYLRDKKVLSHLSVSPIITSSTFCLTDREKKYLEKYFDFPPGFLERVGNDSIRNVEIIKRLAQECSDGRQILFFACSVEHSKFICSMLIYLGFKAAHIDGNTDKTTRHKRLDDFKKKSIQVVCNYGVLSTGFDAPLTDVVFISRPTNSIVLYSQMIGRGLRGPAIGGTSSCKLINVKDNIEGLPNYQNIFEFFEDYWGD